MERISLAQLNNALTTTDSRSQKRLSDEDGLHLTTLLEREQKRWPNQDTAESMEEYLTDFEQLALKYSLQQIREALAELRIDPEQEFFPKPNEVAAAIEGQIHKAAAKSSRRATVKILDEMQGYANEHRKFTTAWLESGLPLAEFCKVWDERKQKCREENAEVIAALKAHVKA